MGKIRTLQDFIEDANLLHQNKYDYSRNTEELHEIIPTRNKVIITCPEHGDFNQRMSHHLGGRGCMLCAYKRKVLTQDKFIERSINKHGDKYNYSKSKYIHSEQLITIECPIHGEFKQTPESHMFGYGCRQCATEFTSLKNKHSLDYFIEKSKIVHNDFYSYEKSIYVAADAYISITCPIHGDFEQLAGEHYAGRGCPTCGKESKGEREISKILESNNIIFSRQKTFDDCRHQQTNYKLRFDFYLPLMNILIEYDGRQHFEPIEYWGGKEGLESTIKRDLIKTKYCESVGITLLRISYLENIEESLIKNNIIS